ncbi:MAG: hypothetical protein QOH31_3985 [Verrucomicrobiota bacterium]|jgi:hypothetical protein
MDTNKTFYFVYLRSFSSCFWLRRYATLCSLLGYFIRVHSRAFAVKEFGPFLTNRTLSLRSL